MLQSYAEHIQLFYVRSNHNFNVTVLCQTQSVSELGHGQCSSIMLFCYFIILSNQMVTLFLAIDEKNYAFRRFKLHMSTYSAALCWEEHIYDHRHLDIR